MPHGCGGWGLKALASIAPWGCARESLVWMLLPVPFVTMGGIPVGDALYLAPRSAHGDVENRTEEGRVLLWSAPLLDVDVNWTQPGIALT